MLSGKRSWILLAILTRFTSAEDNFDSDGDHAGELYLFDGYYNGNQDGIIQSMSKIESDSSFDITENQFKWPDGIVYYHFHKYTGSVTKARLKQAFAYIENRTCVRFKFCDESCSHKVIVKSEPRICESSSLGRHPNGTQFINIGPNCWKLGQIIHELMHVLGFPHEHQRLDRDNYITVIYDRILAEYHPNFDINKHVRPVGKFNFASVMMYPTANPRVSSRGTWEPFIETTIASACQARMGYRRKPTAEHIRKINIFYDCDPSESQCDVRPNHQIVGTTFASHECYTVSECCDLCSLTNDCVGFSWLTVQGGTCLLHENVYHILWTKHTIAGLLRHKLSWSFAAVFDSRVLSYAATKNPKSTPGETLMI